LRACTCRASLHRRRNHPCQIRNGCRDDDRVRRLCEVAELLPSAVARHREDRLCLPFGFVDLLLAIRFRRLDDLLLLALRGIDGRVALTLGRQDD
jgi:hypothetical protein